MLVVTLVFVNVLSTLICIAQVLNVMKDVVLVSEVSISLIYICMWYVADIISLIIIQPHLLIAMSTSALQYMCGNLQLEYMHCWYLAILDRLS